MRVKLRFVDLSSKDNRRSCSVLLFSNKSIKGKNYHLVSSLLVLR